MTLREKLHFVNKGKEAGSEQKTPVVYVEDLSQEPLALPISQEPEGPPPSYMENAELVDGPSAAELNAAFANLNISESVTAFPDPDRCLAHLKLLAAFHNLKEDVGYTDGLFGLWDARCEMASKRDKALAKTREKRWALFIARAVERFEAWWINSLCAQETSKRLEQKDMRSDNLSFMEFMKRGIAQKWTTDMLPPLGTHLSYFMSGVCAEYLQMCLWYGIHSC